jgi:hypothetical protein
MLRKYTAALSAGILRDYGPMLSDENMKDIEGSNDIRELALAIIERGGPFSDKDVKILLKAAGKYEEFTAENSCDAEVLDKFAEHLHNYRYNYKDEATEVDPNIDPSQEHIGLMAQDIEKVNPATVITDEHGYKEVDPGRLSLMMAPAIGELKRQLDALSAEVHGGK